MQTQLQTQTSSRDEPSDGKLTLHFEKKRSEALLLRDWKTPISEDLERRLIRLLQDTPSLPLLNLVSDCERRVPFLIVFEALLSVSRDLPRNSASTAFKDLHQTILLSRRKQTASSTTYVNPLSVYVALVELGHSYLADCEAQMKNLSLMSEAVSHLQNLAYDFQMQKLSAEVANSSNEKLVEELEIRSKEASKLSTIAALKWFIAAGTIMGADTGNFESIAAVNAARLMSDFNERGEHLDKEWSNFWKIAPSSAQMFLAQALLPWVFKLVSLVTTNKTAAIIIRGVSKYYLNAVLEHLLLWNEEKIISALLEELRQQHSQDVENLENLWIFLTRLSEMKVPSKVHHIDLEKLDPLHEIKCLFGKIKDIRPQLPLIFSSSRDKKVAFWSNQVQISDSGKTRPKIMLCIDDDGYEAKLLLKSSDDVRLDRIAQTVISFINCILVDTKIMTYKVVPLKKDAGVIEWIDGTTTLRDALFTKQHFTRLTQSAQMVFAPKNIPQAKAHDMLRRCKSPNECLRVFRDIKVLYKPVLSHLYRSIFRTPHHFLQAQATYVSSTAVHSAIGWVLGLGDRHLKNILMHKSSGEILHIDFGFLFEETRLLPVPERVPFRLTAEIENLMPAGSRASESFLAQLCRTLFLLKINSPAILSAASTVLQDAAKMTAHSKMAGLRLAHKLEGREFSYLSTHSFQPGKLSPAERALYPINASVLDEIQRAE